MTGQDQVGMGDGEKETKTKWKGNRSRMCVESVGGVISGFS